MKNKRNMILVLTTAFAGALTFSAFAQEIVSVKPERPVEAQNSKTSQGKNPNAVATDSTIQTTAGENTFSQGKNNDKNIKGEVTAESHRSAVANTVQNLLMIAEREHGIGEQLKVAARQQNESKEKTADEMTAVESRGKLKTLLFGTDYKNIGALRSDMVQTRNQIDRLKRLVDKVENPQSKVELQTQIQALEQQQSDIDSFIVQNESAFSLFGWAVKLFQ